MSTVQHRQFDQFDEAVAALSQAIATNLEDALAAQGEATLALSGGSTPIPLFQTLSNTALDWQHIRLTLVDERWVPQQDSASNELSIRTHLLKNKAHNAHFFPLKTAHSTPEAACDSIDQMLHQHFDPITALVLGMGDDGHTASLFPHTAALDTALNPLHPARCVACHPNGAPHARLSMSLAALAKADNAYLLLRGRGKRDVLEKALSRTGAEAERDMPIRAVFHQLPHPITVYWAP